MKERVNEWKCTHAIRQVEPEALIDVLEHRANDQNGFFRARIQKDEAVRMLQHFWEYILNGRTDSGKLQGHWPEKLYDIRKKLVHLQERVKAREGIGEQTVF